MLRILLNIEPSLICPSPY